MTERQPAPLSSTFSTAAEITLADGRKLGYAEYGDPHGTPLFLFHGSPGSRLWLGDSGSSACKLGIRVITTDRPGYGVSDPRPGWTLLDWPNDIAALADHLHIDLFVVVGLSAGGVHAAACAYNMPERITLAVLISMPPPPELPSGYLGMSRINRLAFLAGKYAPTLVKFGTAINRTLFRWNPRRYIRLLASQMDPPDRKLLDRADVQQDQIRRYRGAYRQGAAGHAQDIVLLSQPWGFDLREIHVPVQVWHGEEDTVIPMAAGQKVAQLIPDCRLRLVPRTGHLVAERAEHWHALLGLVAESSTVMSTKQL
ncbi:MAG: alpha/beta hydrolase [Chloroflexota bacterium]|nr:alpha/beta hydrolase [Chloroflexota bacterium]